MCLFLCSGLLAGGGGRCVLVIISFPLLLWSFSSHLVLQVHGHAGLPGDVQQHPRPGQQAAAAVPPAPGGDAGHRGRDERLDRGVPAPVPQPPLELQHHGPGAQPVRTPAAARREVAFMYAISSAGVVHTLARACSRGGLDSCSCDPRKTGSSRDARGSFAWGGCSDHVEHAVRFSQGFVDAKERKGRDARALMNLHNNRAGRKAVKRFMTLECKCHGVSGSCSVRTCWLAMADFRRTGDHLRRRYNGAAQVSVNQYGTGFTAAHFKRPSGNDLVYLEDSPDYCVWDPESGSMGTGGRVCNRTSRGVDGCEVMCCGRGYDTSRVSWSTKCECKFHWCCAVRCSDCQQQVDMHTCKDQS